MARSLAGTGPATKLQFLIGVEDDNTTIKVFKSISSAFHAGGDLAAADNTSAVNTDMTLDTGVAATVSTTTWNGHTVPFFAPFYSSGAKCVRFGTNKPYHGNNSAGVTRLLFFCVTKDIGTGNMQMAYGTDSRILKVVRYSGATNPIRFEAGSDLCTVTTSTTASGSDFMIAASLLNGSGDNYAWYVAESGTITTEDTTTSGASVVVGGSWTAFGANTGDDQPWVGKIILAGILKDDYADNAARRSVLNDIASDPYGTFFGAAGQSDALTGASSAGALGSFGKSLTIQL